MKLHHVRERYLEIMMRFLIFLFLIAIPTLTAAQSIDDDYAEMRDAAERCESAWFERSRKKALDDLEKAGIRLVVRLNPLSRDHKRRMAYVKEATAELRKCGQRVYGD
jgi:hypothetical protein